MTDSARDQFFSNLQVAFEAVSAGSHGWGLAHTRVIRLAGELVRSHKGDADMVPLAKALTLLYREYGWR